MNIYQKTYKERVFNLRDFTEQNKENSIDERTLEDNLQQKIKEQEAILLNSKTIGEYVIEQLQLKTVLVEILITAITNKMREPGANLNQITISKDDISKFISPEADSNDPLLQMLERLPQEDFAALFRVSMQQMQMISSQMVGIDFRQIMSQMGGIESFEQMQQMGNSFFNQSSPNN